MMLYFSKSTKGFYLSDVHSKEQIPSDVVIITEEAHAALLKAQSEGKIIESDELGNPIAVNEAVPSSEQIKTGNKHAALVALIQSDLVVLRCVEQSIPLPTIWGDYREKLRIIANSGEGNFPSKPEYPSKGK